MILVLTLLIILAFAGAPIFSVILAFAAYGFYDSDISLTVIPIEIYRLTETPILVALPLFTFAGYLLSESNAAKRFVDLTHSVIGAKKGALAILALVISSFFTAFTGASGVTIVALGAVLLPALHYAGYQKKFSLGLVTTSGSLGILLPPSIPLILYGVIIQQIDSSIDISINDLFLAGILPCFFMITALSLWSIWANRHLEITRQNHEIKFIEALKASAWELPLPIFVLLAIYSGFLALSEIAVFTVLYVFIVEVLIHREVSMQSLIKVIKDSMMASGGIFIILGAALAMSNMLIDKEVPYLLFSFMQEHIHSKWVFLALLNLLLLFIGAFLDIFSALLIIVPLILPTAIGFDVDPVHLGIIFLANLQIGYLTPPVGMNLFIASFRFKLPVMEVCKASLPFLAVLLICLIVITYVPQLSLFLVD